MSTIRVGTITYDWYLFDPRVRRLAEAAADAGYSVDVICVRQPHEPRYEECNGVHIHRVAMERGFGRSLGRSLYDWSRFLLLASEAVTQLHMKQRYDVVHVHNMPDFLIFSALMPRLLGAKVILDVQDACPELMQVKASRLRGLSVAMASWQERSATAFADHVVTMGWTLEELLLKRGVKRSKLTSILNSADPKFFPPEKRTTPYAGEFNEQRPMVLMFHGTLAARQGLETALKAMALALPRAPHLRFDIKGRGEQLPILKRVATELGLTEKVIFTDMSPYAEVVDFITQGDVGIIPYLCDGYMELVLPTKAYEFAWMERPMISSDTPGMRSLFRPESVVLCDAMRPESFAEAIVDLYHHPEKRQSLVQNACEDYAPYRWEIMAQRYQELLAELSGHTE